MKVKLHESVKSLYWKTDGYVIYTTKHGVFGHRIPARKPGWRPSRDQRAIQKIFAAAGHAWKTLPAAVQKSWQRYERRYLPYRNRGVERRPTGLTGYIQAGMMRQLLGLEPCAQAPAQSPPAPPASVRVLPCARADEFQIEIVHGHKRVKDFAVAVRITPATQAPGCTPMASSLRFVRGVRRESTAELPPSGHVVRFTKARFAVPHGERFAVGVRIVRVADGTASEEFVCDAIRQLFAR